MLVHVRVRRREASSEGYTCILLQLGDTQAQLDCGDALEMEDNNPAQLVSSMPQFSENMSGVPQKCSTVTKSFPESDDVTEDIFATKCKPAVL